MVNLYEDKRVREYGYQVVCYDIVMDETYIGAANIFDCMDDRAAYVDDIHIIPEHRNKGVGTFVLKALADRYNGIVLCPDNPDAARLYDRLGHAVVDPNGDYPDQGYGIYIIY